MPNIRDEWWTGRPGEFGDLSPFTLERTEYSVRSETPVRCVPVTLQRRVIGYLWASETEDAADFYAKRGTGVAGYNAGGRWRARLVEARKAGFTAWEAVQLWLGEPEDLVAGGVPAEARVLPNSWAVRQLLRQRYEEEQ
ncbi:hypothetical protein [Saccharopolyspora sp. 5N708]|uniref:hypothetical protein n=1 Tax=Saccharopolyspora sp. 5N708 TaxID=3457424 RepID=UPI003FD0B5E6